MRKNSKYLIALLLFFTPIELLSSPFHKRVQKEIDTYESKPIYITKFCGALRSHNRRNNASVFDPLFVELMTESWSMPKRHYRDLVLYMTSTYCPDVY